MAKPTLTAVAGDAVTTMLIPGTSLEVQLFGELDADGHIIGSRPLYTVWFPPVLVANNREVGEIFNAHATEVVRLRGIWIVSTNTIITGVQLGFSINQITTVGSTGSTTRTPRKTDKQFSHTLNASITCRDGSTAGATLDYLHWVNYMYNDETSAGSALSWAFNAMPEQKGEGVFQFVLRQNEGIQVKITQLTGTAAGLVGCLMYFAVDN